MNEFIPHASWMRDIPEDTPVTALSIPGTHNSASIGGLFGFAQTQNLDLATQLDRGIRFLDIRLAQCQSDLHVHHDMKCMGKDYTDILTVCRNFLDKHPSETILMSIKDESDVDSNSDKLAPSQVLRKWSGGDVVNRNNIPSFEEGPVHLCPGARRLRPVPDGEQGQVAAAGSPSAQGRRCVRHACADA
jgi:hypothetical protein